MNDSRMPKKARFDSKTEREEDLERDGWMVWKEIREIFESVKNGEVWPWIDQSGDELWRQPKPARVITPAN